MIDIFIVSKCQLLGILLYELKLKQIYFHQCLLFELICYQEYEANVIDLI